MGKSLTDANEKKMRAGLVKMAPYVNLDGWLAMLNAGEREMIAIGNAFRLNRRSYVYDAPKVASLLGLQFSDDEFASFGPCPDPVPGFLTVFDPGCSIMRMRSLVQGRKRPGFNLPDLSVPEIYRKRPRKYACDYFGNQTWYVGHAFTVFIEKPRYRYVPLSNAEAYFAAKADDGQGMLFEDDGRRPTCRSMVCAMLVHLIATGKGLFTGGWIHCEDKAQTVGRVNVISDSGGGTICFDDGRGICMLEALGANVPRFLALPDETGTVVDVQDLSFV